jgi:hypothetical protein
MSQLYRQSCINGHPATVRPDNGKPWRCGDPECEYFDGADDTALGLDVERCPTCGGVGWFWTSPDKSENAPKMDCLNCHGSGVKTKPEQPITLDNAQEFLDTIKGSQPHKPENYPGCGCPPDSPNHPQLPDLRSAVQIAAEYSNLSQWIQMRVWEYMDKPPKERNGVELADSIIRRVRGEETDR